MKYMHQIKPSRKRAFITQAVGGYILTMIAIVKGLFLLPLYFKFISYADYGYWVTIASIVALLSIVNFGIGTMVTQRISKAYAKDDFQTVGDYFINSVVIYVVIAIAFLFFGFILSFWLDSILNISIKKIELFKIAFYIALNTTALSFFSNSFRGFAGALLKPLFGMYVMIGANLFGVFLVIVLLYSGIGILSLPISLFVAELLIVVLCGIYVVFLYKQFHINVQVKVAILKEYLAFSPHLFGLAVGNKLIEQSHPIIITTFLGAEVTTAYDITRKVVQIILQALNVLNSSLLAPFSHLVGEGDAKLIQRTTIKIITLSFLMGLMGYGVYISTNLMFINLWIGKDISLKQNIIILIGISAFAFSMNGLFRSLLFGFDKIKFISNMVFVEGVIYIVFSAVFINLFGIIAIPMSLLMISVFFAIKFSRELLLAVGIKIDSYILVKYFIMISLIAISLFVIDLWFDSFGWMNFIYKVFLTIVVIIIWEMIFNISYVKNIIK